VIVSGPLSPNSIPQNLSKWQGDGEMSGVVVRGNQQKIALLPLGSKGSEVVPVRLDHLAANLPHLAARLTASVQSHGSLSAAVTTGRLPTMDITSRHDTSLGHHETSGLFYAQDENYAHNNIHEDLSFVDARMSKDLQPGGSLDYASQTSSENTYTLMADPVPEVSGLPVYKSKLEKAIAQNQLSQLKAETQSQLSHLIKVSNNDDMMMSMSHASSPAKCTVNNSFTQIKPFDPRERISGVCSESDQNQPKIQQMPISSITRNIEIKQSLKSMPIKKQHTSQVRVSAGNQMSVDSSTLQSNVAQTTKDTGPLQLVEMSGPGSTDQVEPVYLYVTRSRVAARPSQALVVTEKKYTDYDLASDLLQNMWKLRQEHQEHSLCDAVLYCDQGQVKVPTSRSNSLHFLCL